MSEAFSFRYQRHSPPHTQWAEERVSKTLKEDQINFCSTA
jgi:hypothetical protein